MRYLIASDIHGALPAAEMLVARFCEEGADRLLLLGDLLYHGPRNPLPEGYAPAQVAKLLNGYADRITAVRGNCDCRGRPDGAELPLPRRLCAGSGRRGRRCCSPMGIWIWRPPLRGFLQDHSYSRATPT